MSQKTLIWLIFLAGLLAYAVMFNDHFKTADDLMTIVHNENIRHFSRLPEIFGSSFFGTSSYYRPLVAFSHMLEYHLFGLQAFFYYLTNLILHLASALTIFFLMRLFFSKAVQAFCIALLFAIHPIHWEAVSNISGRAILLCGFFYLTHFYFSVYFISSRRKFILFFHWRLLLWLF